MINLIYKELISYLSINDLNIDTLQIIYDCVYLIKIEIKQAPRICQLNYLLKIISDCQNFLMQALIINEYYMKNYIISLLNKILLS